MISNQFFSQNNPNILGNINSLNFFGAALATGDFDGDDYDDLSVGIPGESISSLIGAGAASIFYGTRNGVTVRRNQRFHQNRSGIRGVARIGEFFGSSFGVGDFNGDGKDDLSVGAPQDRVGSVNSGAVNVLYGANQGLVTRGNQLFHQNSTGIRGVAGVGDLFGSTLGAGDFNDDGKDDLAIGVFGKTIAGQDNAGSVNVLYGSDAGLSSKGNQLFTQNSAGIRGRANANDFFGASLTVGDFNEDGKTILFRVYLEKA